MAGPGDTDYVASLQALADRLGIGDRVVWPGMLAGDAKWGALYGADAMVLTSYQENFGVVVAEALACRTPVIISDQVNICTEVQQADAGIVCRPETTSVAEALGGFAAMSERERSDMTLRGRALFARAFSMRETAARLIDLFADSAEMEKQLSYS